MPKPTFQHVFPVAVSNLTLPAAGQVNVDDAGAGVLVVEVAATGCAVGVAGLVSSVFGVDIRTSQEGAQPRDYQLLSFSRRHYGQLKVFLTFFTCNINIL